MPRITNITGPCVITICQRQSTNWKKVTEFVISKGQANCTLPEYVHLGDIICLNCYNGIVTRSSIEFQPVENSYGRRGCKIRVFDELYLSSNASSKNKDSQEFAKKQLLFICYFLCGIRNKFVNSAKRDLTMYLDSTGASNTSIDTLANLGHTKIIDFELTKHANEALILNIGAKQMPNTTTTSTAAHLATILINPITTQMQFRIDAELIKINIENKFMAFYSISHNQRWNFRIVNDDTKIEELTVHNYDVRLKEKHNIRSIKDTIIDLQENNLHSLDAYIKAINVVTSVPAMQQYIQNGYIIPIVADWPAISRYLCYHNLSKITDNILSFLPIIEMYKYIFGDRKPLAQKPKPWQIKLLLEIARSAWQEISITVEKKFGFCKDAKYLALKDLLDNTIPLVLDIYAVFFRSGDFDAYLESCFRIWTIFLKFRLSNIFYWELNNHSILEIIKVELPKFSDSTVEIFHSFLRRSTQKYTEAQQIIKCGHYINQLWLDDNGFKENFANTSTWATYEYSARDILNLTKITSIKMPEAELSHLPLGFKPNPLCYCDSSNCSVLLDTDVKILACGHTYHNFCYVNNGFKCLHCLSFLQNGIDEQVQSLLERLQVL
ncbi:hypothetical protein Glove_461g14 [Diversispora epigaea]|uniref:Uncharacterized protein n=1 Tax=Diversispora epigaea TaxID=1348612 RepID=A0A397GMX2_9GLOM|nr:hypothetical protein Glove_461g14 [Diversispora epigaea]